MNRISRYIIAAFGAVVTLVSCTKEPALVPEGSGLLPQGQLREIAVSFGESTKTVLGTTVDGTYHKYKPAFCVGDRIKVSNATRSEDCVVADVGGVLKIFTNLEGELKAVYPASAANVTGINPIPETDQFKISTTQTGKFSDANICTATIAADGTAASFENQTALLRFYVDGSIGVQKITINGTENLATTGSNLKVITVTAPTDKTLADVTEEPDKRLCYVAVLPGTNTLGIESVTTTQGTVSKTMKADFNYTQNGIFNAFLPYYIKIKVKDSPEVYQKWAYCNIGAFLPEEPGKYFAWGANTGQVADTTRANGAFGNAYSWNNCPHTSGVYSADNKKVFTKYSADKDAYAKSGTADGRTVLDLSNDAAYLNLGENWSMPTKDDFVALIVGTSTTTADIGTSRGRKCLTVNGSSLMFPAVGHGSVQNTSSLLNAWNKGIYYWSRSLYCDGPQNAYYLKAGPLGTSDALILEPDSAENRRVGCPIRPIFHDPTDLSINPYVDDDIIK